MTWKPSPDGDERSPRRHLNRDERRALKAQAFRLFVDQYGRKAQKGIEPNDRRYSRDVEGTIKRMRPEMLDEILRDDDA